MKIIFAADFAFPFVQEKGTPEGAQKAMKDPASIFKDADFSVVNLESCFGDASDYEPIVKSGPNIISDISYFDYIRVLNPTAVCLANNHCCDYGEQAMVETIDLLKKSSFVPFGAGMNLDEAYVPAYFEKDGQKVAIIGVCENEFGCATIESSGSAGYSLGRVTKAISKARRDGVLPIVFFHGGNETNPFPSPMKRELYRHFVDIGAAAVIAMHTHCPQGYEIYDGAPIVYSMGNFCFPHGSGKPSWYFGYMTELSIDKENISLKCIPYRQGFEGVTLLKGGEKEDFFKYLDAITRPIADEKKIRDYFDTWCAMQSWFLSPMAAPEERGHNKTTASSRNRMTCEAHNELTTRLWRITFEGTVEAAAERIPVIHALQAMEIPPELAE